MKKLSTFIIIIGIMIMAAPMVGKMITSYNEAKLIENWAEEPIEEDPAVIPSTEQSISVLTKVLDEEKTAEPVAPAAPSPKDKQKVLGIIEISKIKVKLPIVEGVESSNLKAGIGHIPGTAGLGQVGNCALAGHRSYTFGNFFNRLDELEIGDNIVISDKENKYTYIVYDKIVVLPEDVSVLKKNGDDSILTLITCTPIRVATHRLIIHAKLEEGSQ